MIIHRIPSGRGARLRRALALASAALLLTGMVGCDDPLSSPLPSAVATVALTPPAATMVVGDSVVLQAVVRSAAGDTLTGRTIQWTSSDTTVASVRAGVVKARKAGTTTIQATVEGKTAAAGLTVLTPPQPAAPMLRAMTPSQSYAGESGVSLTLIGDDFHRDALVLVNGSARPAVAPGVGQLRVELTGQDLAEAGVLSIEVANPTGTRSQALLFTVLPRTTPPDRFLVITPDPLIMLAGTSRSMTAGWINGTGHGIPGTPRVVWWTADTLVATVDASGTVTGRAHGQTRLYAAGEGYFTSSVVEVRRVPIGPEILYQTRTLPPSGPVVDSVTWEAGLATPVRAAFILRSVRLTLMPEAGRYVQEFTVYVRSGEMQLGLTGWFERGSLTYSWLDGTFRLTPDGRPGGAFVAGPYGVGELYTRQAVRAGPMQELHYVIQ